MNLYDFIRAKLAENAESATDQLRIQTDGNYADSLIDSMTPLELIIFIDEWHKL